MLKTNVYIMVIFRNVPYKIKKGNECMKMIFVLLLSFFAAGSIQTYAQVRLPRLVRDSMILQRDVPVNIWGWASAGEKVSVKLNGRLYKTKANDAGEWKVTLPPSKAGGPYSMEVSGKNKIVLKDILFGEVWLCSGQSNMVHQLNIHDVTYEKVISQANDPDIRQFWVPTLTSLQGPQNDLTTGYWKPAVGEEVRPFSAVAYFFAKKIHDRYMVPVGIINASVGGTPIEAWISEQGFKDFAVITNTIQKNKDTGYLNSLNRRPAGNRPSPPQDAGMTASPKWFEEGYLPKGWRNINIPGYWEDQGIKDLNGIVWYRKEVDIPASMAGKPAKVFLGRIVDADELYINGTKVGNTTYQYPQRRYPVPAGLLKAGKNIFVIRVTNTNGKGGFVPDKPYCLFAGTDTVDLKGYWQYKVGAVFIPSQGGGFAGGGINAQNQPTALYNAMVAHAVNYNIKGICWYQGESNAGRPQEYEKLLKALISDWRAKWMQDSLPFLYVQLPGFMDYNYLPAESQWAMLREAQLSALSVPNTAMAVAIDLGEWNDIHPDNKKDVGERLALAAFKTAYHENIVYSGPIFQSATVEGNKMRITFTQTGSGLATGDGEEPGEFAIAGADKKFVWARASIEGDKVIVWNDDVPAPMYVRYAWADNPVNPNLINKEGLPASPFRTDK
jgi:sialate O-acetylesterase